MSVDCNRRFNRRTATIWNAIGRLAIDSKHIFPVHAATDNIRCWLFHAESAIFRPPRHNIVDGGGRDNIQYCYNWYVSKRAGIQIDAININEIRP